MSEFDEYAARRNADAEAAWLDDQIRQAVLEERERCAAICDRLAQYIEDGQIPRSPDRRLRQAAKYIREPRLTDEATNGA